MGKLQGKVAVITGGNSGIGLATAQTLAREGARIAIFGRNSRTLDDAVATLGDCAIGVRGDVRNMVDLDNLFSATKESFGNIDILFVNAGSAKVASMDEIDEALFDEIVGINFKGAFFTIQKALPLLNDGASIVLTTSSSIVKGMPNLSIYAATKAALRSLARSASAELLKRRIRVNTVSPGPIRTPIYGRLGLAPDDSTELERSFEQRVPMKRFGSPSEIAAAVLFLASDDSSYCLGTDLVVDGGLTQL